MSLAHAATPAPARDPRDPGAPSRVRLIANFVVFEAAWFACILGVAHGVPAWGTAAIVAAIAWHVAISARPSAELALVVALCAIGLAAETLVVALGHVAYPNGQPVAWLPPFWLVALWAEFAIALNVTLRWLRGRPLLAALLGAVFGPLSFIGGVRLGAARFVDETAALATLAVLWMIIMPLVTAIAPRLDGVTRHSILREDHA
jgi:hypothetical protein